MAIKKIDIRLTENFRLRADDRNFIIVERRFTDPTRSPNWEGLKKNGKSPEPRETWRDSGYYPLSPTGLTAAIHAVGLREVGNNGSEITSPTELLDEYKRNVQEICGIVDSRLPEVEVRYARKD